MKIVTCTMCNTDWCVSATDEQIKAWQDGQLIQVAMPDVTPAERELLMTGICGPCFKNLFAQKE